MSVFKKLLIVLFSSFVGIISNPELPFASDTVAVTGISGAVETVFIDETVTEVVDEEPASTVAYDPVLSEPVAPAPSPVEIVSPQPAPVVIPSNYISIAGRTIDMVNVENTAVDSGNHVNKYGDRLIYGHNSASVFGFLKNVGVGEVFSVTENGVTRNYRVQSVAIYEKLNDYTLSLDGQTIKMVAVANARHNGKKYDLSLMTCYGTSYGNGDASHRLVLFASAI